MTKRSSRAFTGPVLTGLLLSAGTAFAATEVKHHYSIYGSLETLPGETAQPTSHATLEAPRPVLVQSGSGYSLIASLEQSPMACASDEIFGDGFDG